LVGGNIRGHVGKPFGALVGGHVGKRVGASVFSQNISTHT
jgi:hypothetical protein